MEEISSTQQKLLDTGKQEFLAKGFKSASLRRIVKEAGFTLGAFYGYYPDKEALFKALAAPAADGLLDQFRQAQDRHFDLIEKKETSRSRELSNQYLAHFVGYIYDNYDAFKLVVCCAEGTKYENYIHDLVELEVDRTEEYYAQLRQLGKLKGSLSREVNHMLTSAYFTSIFEVVVHDMEREKALGYVEQIAMFFNYGWDGILKII